MALFGKKTTIQEAPPEEAAASTDDFSPAALAALAESLESGETDVQDGSALQVRKPVSFKNGSVLGVNIGADTMKAVELTARNGSCTVTGIAIAPTPPDSIANGVVMSVNVLADAVKELIAPFKTKKVVTSVAGTGEVIVRVIEVPTMTDAELQENMNTDLDRYIPFPPSDVQWDAAAMRDLPTDPNATNMDVLLVAARHELIDLHLQLLTAIKVDPKAIDVEPLAAARALSGPLSGNGTHVDYNDVCTVLDIGSSATEISILRGDELVFTRTVPVAGNTMTQALADKLNLSNQDAERLKREKGDALPAQNATASANVATVNENTEVVEEDAASGFDDIILPDVSPAETLDAPADVPAESSDPFDLDLFNQGPTQSEPGEQHQQKMPDPADGEEDTSQLPSKSPQHNTDVDIDSDDASLPSKAEETLEAQSAKSGAIASFFDFDENELDEHSEQLPTIEGKPQQTEAPPHEDDEPGVIDWDDDSFLPSVAATEATGASLPSAFTFPESESPKPGTPASEAPADEAPVAVSKPSGFSLDDIVMPAAAAVAEEKSAVLPVVEAPMVEPVQETPVDDIDLSDILGDAPESTPTLDIDEGLGGTIDLDEDGADVGLGGLGTGLDVEEKPHDEAAVHAVLKPVLDDLAGELRRSLEYHTARYPDAPVKRIVLIGGGAKMRNLDTYFAQELGVPAVVGNPFQNLNTNAPQVNQQLLDEHSNAFVIALGLAMREIIR